MENIITLENIVKYYYIGKIEVRALRSINLDIDKNEFVAIMGPSGSGKSTLMNIIGCLDTPTVGKYVLNNNIVSHIEFKPGAGPEKIENHNGEAGSMITIKKDDLSMMMRMEDNQLADIRNNEIGFIFQTFNLLPRYSALENVMLPLVYAGVSKSERIQRAKDTLDSVGLGDRMEHKPNELSGGQRQRVAVARALVNRPAIILADEPTGNLDSKTSIDIMNLIDEIHDRGNTIILVTHEEGIALRARRIIRLIDGNVESIIVREEVTVSEA